MKSIPKIHFDFVCGYQISPFGFLIASNDKSIKLRTSHPKPYLPVLKVGPLTNNEELHPSVYPQ